MNRQKIIKLLNPYIDRVLDAGTAQQVDEHLISCPVCREEYLKLKQVVSAVNSLSPQAAPENLTENIMAKISQEEIQIQSSWMDFLRERIAIPSLSFPPILLSFPRKRESIFSFRLAGIAVAAALVMFFAFTFIFNTPDTPSICSAEVQFSLRIGDSKAHTVAIAGDFNGWSPQANLLEDPDGDGIWTATLDLEPGRYEYMFVLDGEKWFPDPNALRYVKDGFGNKNAILEINNCNSS
jgi:hypothetical protein